MDPSYRGRARDPRHQAYAHALVHDQAQADPRYAACSCAAPARPERDDRHHCDRLELSVTAACCVTPDAGTFGALRYPPAFADLSGASAARTPAGAAARLRSTATWRAGRHRA